MLWYLKKKKFRPCKHKKTALKSCILMAVCIFFSAALTAQNSPELHFHFIDSCMQWSVVLYLGWYGTILVTQYVVQNQGKKILTFFYFEAKYWIEFEEGLSLWWVAATPFCIPFPLLKPLWFYQIWKSREVKIHSGKSTQIRFQASLEH